jgi:hypothetical protein
VSERGNGFPKAEAIWLALAIVIWAVAEALEDGRGERFIAALERRADEHEALRRVVTFGTTDGQRSMLRRHAGVASQWLSRVAAELRAARR